MGDWRVETGGSGVGLQSLLSHLPCNDGAHYLIIQTAKAIFILFIALHKVKDLATGGNGVLDAVGEEHPAGAEL